MFKFSYGPRTPVALILVLTVVALAINAALLLGASIIVGYGLHLGGLR